MRTLVQHALPIRLYPLALAVLIPAALCQTITTGEITGTVLDPAGKLVIRATVQLRSIDTGESRSVPSSGSGVYRFVFVRPGGYEISAKSEGLTSDIARIVASVGQAQSLDLHLKLEQSRESVLVTDVAPLLNADNADFVYTLSTRQLDLLPLPGGDLVGVAYSVPGVVINNRFGNGNFVLQGVGSVSNLFTINGVDDMDPYPNVNNSGPTGLLLGANEVQQASVIQNAFEGQYGRQAGAQVNYVTKSGTNSYHGNLVYSYNGTRLNANGFFSNATGTPRPLAISNQYAASFGGPIVRNKLFFFTDTEGLHYAYPNPAYVAAVPSPALESYALRRIQPSQVSFYQNMFDLYNSTPGIGRAVLVTNGNSPLQDSSGRLGCGRLAGTPTGEGGVFGTDVSCARAWETNKSTPISEWLLTTRVDYNLSPNQRLFFRFKTDHGFLTWNHKDLSPLFDGISRQPDYEGQVNHTLVISPRLVNNFIGSVTYNDYGFYVASPAAARAFPFRITIGEGGANGGGILPAGPPPAAPFGRRDGQLQIVDDVSYNTGRHFFNAGVNYRYNREADLIDASIGVGHFTLSRLRDFVNGRLTGKNPSSYSQNFNPNPVFHIRLYNFGAYIQDQWVVTPRLKITATVRFDRTGNPYCLDRCFARLIRPFAEISKDLSIPYNQSIQAGQAHAFYSIEPIIPQPRFAVAYSPAWSPGTVFRGGIGLFSDLYPAVFASTLGGNPPNIFPAYIQTGLINAGGTGSAPAIAAASANAFESGFGAGATLGQIAQAVAPNPFGPPGYYSFPSTLRTPKSLQWSFEIQHQFGLANLLAVRYMGNHGYDIFLTDPNANANADPSIYPNGFANLPAAPPDPRFTVVQQLTNHGYSNYHALLIDFRRAFAHGFQGQISYTWSHALDTISNGGISYFSYDSQMDQINPASLRSLNYSNADYDVRHNLTGDLIWEMPVKLRNRFMDSIFGRWSLGAKLSTHTGTPFSVVNGALSSSASFGGTAMADLLDPNIRTNCGRAAIATPCFTPSQFVPAATQADFGNLPRNFFRGPGFFDVDSTLCKTFVRSERMRFILGASAFNLLNHPNFADPNGDISSPGLGLIEIQGINPSGPYGYYGGPAGRALVVMGKVVF